MNKNGLKSKMIMQVHDELVFDVIKSEREELEENVKSIMENVIKIKVPLTVDVGIGKTWLEAH
jgi:DNA polymerase-1